MCTINRNGITAILYYNKNKNWLQFLFVVEAAALKSKYQKLYP